MRWVKDLSCMAGRNPVSCLSDITTRTIPISACNLYLPLFSAKLHGDMCTLITTSSTCDSTVGLKDSEYSSEASLRSCYTTQNGS